MDFLNFKYLFDYIIMMDGQKARNLLAAESSDALSRPLQTVIPAELTPCTAVATHFPP